MNNRRILIVGAAGQVGRELQRSFQDCGDVVAVDRESVNVESADETRELVLRSKPDVILNAAAYTAVDRAESEPVAALAINAQAPQVLAEEAKRMGSLLDDFSFGITPRMTHVYNVPSPAAAASLSIARDLVTRIFEVMIP